jgi:hypothetical protein
MCGQQDEYYEVCDAECNDSNDEDGVGGGGPEVIGFGGDHEEFYHRW